RLAVADHDDHLVDLVRERDRVDADRRERRSRLALGTDLDGPARGHDRVGELDGRRRPLDLDLAGHAGGEAERDLGEALKGGQQLLADVVPVVARILPGGLALAGRGDRYFAT